MKIAPMFSFLKHATREKNHISIEGYGATKKISVQRVIKKFGYKLYLVGLLALG